MMSLLFPRFPNFFSEDDIAWYDDMFDTCASVESLDAHMAAKFKWAKLPSRENASPEVLQLEHVRWSGVPPLTHQNFTAAEKRKMIADEQKAREEDDKLLDEKVKEYLAGKDHGRGVRALSRASKERLRYHERKAIAAALGINRAPVDREDVVKVIGGSWGGKNKKGEHYETLYLLQWTGYEGDANEFQWLGANSGSVNVSDLSNQLLGQRVAVYWVPKQDGAVKQSVYMGTCTDIDANDVERMEAAGWNEEAVKVQYDFDCTAELVNLETLQTLRSECNECGKDTKPTYKRIAWVLESVLQEHPTILAKHHEIAGAYN